MLSKSCFIFKPLSPATNRLSSSVMSIRAAVLYAKNLSHITLFNRKRCLWCLRFLYFVRYVIYGAFI